MIKKFSFIFLLAVLLVTACSPATEVTSTAEPIEDAVGTVEEEIPAVSIDGDWMPCSTIYDYQTTLETNQYQAAVDQQPPVTEDDWIYGNPDAPITVVEYEDFQCPACPGFSLGIKQLIDTYPSTIRVVFRHLPLASIHDKAYLSSMAAEAAGAQGKFWEMHDILYYFQSTWTGISESEFVEWVKEQAEALGLILYNLKRIFLIRKPGKNWKKRLRNALNKGCTIRPLWSLMIGFGGTTNPIYMDSLVFTNLVDMRSAHPG